MPARFKLDENLPRDAEALLRKAGHDVHTVLDEQLGGNPDPRVFDASQAEDRILVTFDLDFSDIRVYPPASHTGIWVLRPHAQSIDNTLAVLRAALRVLETEPTQGRLWIVEPDRVRLRE
jgi:predicted nuclease of predicted toxin-antitoxin system